MCHSKINKSLNQLQSQYLNCLNKHQLKTNETTEQISALKRSIKEHKYSVANGNQVDVNKILLGILLKYKFSKKNWILLKFNEKELLWQVFL